MYHHWKLEVKEKIAHLILNRPDMGNRVGAKTLEELDLIANELTNNDYIWVVILSGAGEHFSTGADVSMIGEMIGQDKKAFAESLRRSQEVLDKFEAVQKPVIGLLHGYVIGAGIIISLCCDFRISSDDAVFSLPEVKRSIGVLMGTQRITKTIGVGHTKELVMLGDPVLAERAYEMGLVSKVVPKEQLHKEGMMMAQRLLQLPPLAVGACKKIINEGKFMDRAGQDLEIEVQAGLLDSEDFKEAIASFFEKRMPVYLGK